MLRITEIFHSIQGESTHAGRPCLFVRLTGCPLRCTWCDTDYAFYGGREMSEDTIVSELNQYHCNLVEVTGGEPLHQPMVFPFITTLCQKGFEVLIETSGAIDTAPVDHRAQIILDVKCPGSEMVDRMYWPNLHRLRKQDQAKFVIGTRRDYEWAVDIIHRYKLTQRCPILFSPVFGELPYQELAEWILKDGLPVRFQMQLHKYIWEPHTRGV